jgi:hypothetical protein
MLADAGVDTLIFDATNAFTYDNIWSKIGTIYLDLRSKSIRTPQFCFITWTSSEQTVRSLSDNLYSQNLFSDLCFLWDGKPLYIRKSSWICIGFIKFLYYTRIIASGPKMIIID